MMKMIFRRPPIAPLHPYIEAFAAFEKVPGNDHLAFLNIPSVHSYIMFKVVPSLGRIGAKVIVVGSHSAVSEFLIDGLEVIGVRIRPGCLKYFLNVPSNELQDQNILLEKIWGRNGKELTERMWEASTHEKRIQIIEDFLLRQLSHHRAEVDFVGAAYQMIQDSRWRISIHGLADRMGFSDRQMERKFMDYSGFTPKAFFKAARCRTVVQRILNRQFRDWTQMVYDYNYYDQSHFIREFSQAMKLAPGDFLERLQREIEFMPELHPDPVYGLNHLVASNTAATTLLK